MSLSLLSCLKEQLHLDSSFCILIYSSCFFPPNSQNFHDKNLRVTALVTCWGGHHAFFIWQLIQSLFHNKSDLESQKKKEGESLPGLVLAVSFRS